jgi:hypothetical protein
MNAEDIEPCFPPPSLAETSEMHKFFVKRLKELGMYDKDSDYDGMIGNAVE